MALADQAAWAFAGQIEQQTNLDDDLQKAMLANIRQTMLRRWKVMKDRNLARELDRKNRQNALQAKGIEAVGMLIGGV